MENFTKIPTSILKDKTLNPSEKIILSYIYTFQSNGKYFYDTQSNLADEVGMDVSSVKRIISKLKERKLIFTLKKSLIDGRKQYKNRLCTIMVDEENPYPTNDVDNVQSDELSIKSDVVVSENKLKSLKIDISKEENDYIKELIYKKESRLDVGSYDIKPQKCENTELDFGKYNYL